MLRHGLIAAALLMAPATASAAELIVNGGFENPIVASSCCSTVPPDSLPGWTVTAGNVNVVNGTFNSTGNPLNLAYEGSQYLDLVGQGGVGSISQSFATVAGQVYTLTFAFAHNLFGGNTPPPESASYLLGTLGGVLTHTTGTTSNLDWRTITGNFTATGPLSTLYFTNLTGGLNEGIFLDAVSVQNAVPEASTWAMMLIGFGLLGGATRFSRRRHRVMIRAAV